MTEDTTMATKTTDQRTVAELEAAILDGDASITAEMLNAARLRDQHTALLTEARIRREQAEARAARVTRSSGCAATSCAWPTIGTRSPRPGSLRGRAGEGVHTGSGPWSSA